MSMKRKLYKLVQVAARKAIILLVLILTAICQVSTILPVIFLIEGWRSGVLTGEDLGLCTSLVLTAIIMGGASLVLMNAFERMNA